jgi:peptidoglycan biosynthesis protein MviN/MurJ (putative lipid II flippase)
MNTTTRNFTIAWLGGIPIAIINAAIRNIIFQPYTGELLAHQLSSVTMILIFAAYFWLLNKRWPITSDRQAAIIGVIWLVLTMIFEFIFGHYIMGHSWNRLLADYNIFSGRLWSLVLIWILIGPYLVYRSSQR